MHGPRRVITFCLLTAVLPTVLLVIPLYLRHSLYADVAYEVTESDVLKIVEGISSVFCQEHSLKMNSTFSAYQLSGEPTMSPTKKMIHMKKSMILPDDTLEYWGFYLLNGSVMVLSACSRFEGGRVMVVRGDRNLKTCGLLDHKTKKQPIQQTGAGGKENVRRTNKVRITFENTPDTRVENNPKNPEVSPFTVKPTVNPRTTGKPVIGEEVIDIEDKVSGEEAQRGKEEGEGQEVEELGVDETEKTTKPSEKADGYEKEGSGNDEEDEGSREEEEEEVDGRVEEDDDDDFQGSGDGVAGDGDSISLNPEELALIRRIIEEQRRRGEGKARKHVRHEKKRLRELAMLEKSKERNGEERRKRRSVAKGSADGASRSTGRERRFARLQRLRRELAEERRREKREEVRLVDGGMKHGGTALNYTKRENEEDSDSSFEMGLKDCYGGDVEFQEEFSPSDSCSEDVASEDTDPNSKEISKPSIRVEHEIQSNGYYYYIFYSDNDRVMNEVHAAFDIHKTVYEYGSGKSENSGIVCINVTNCTFPVGFLSGAIVMVEVPTRDGIDRDVMDEVGGPQGALLISSCHPRMAVYIIFPVTVLFLILGCAFL